MIDMQKIGWENSPSTNTPISAENLKQMENNVENAINELFRLKTSNMTLYNADNHTYNHTGSNSNLEEPIVFGYSAGNPNGLLSKQENEIKIGAGVKHINIKANALVRLGQSNQTTDIFISIRKNGQKLATANFYQSGYGPGSYAPYSSYVPVKEGDLIGLYLAGTNSNINVLDESGDSRLTQLTVEVVD